MRGRPKAELVLGETEREQLAALTLGRKTAQVFGVARSRPAPKAWTTRWLRVASA